MRRLLVSLGVVLAAIVSTPVGAAADLTTQADATLTCSDGHSVIMTLDQSGLTNLLGEVQAVNTSGLMTCDVTTSDPSSDTADWTVYDYNPSDRAIAPRHSPDSLPATTSGTTTTFNFKDGVYTALLTTTDSTLTGDLSTKTVSDTISLSGPPSGFMTQNNGGDCASNVPAAVRFYFTAPSASGPSVGTPPAGFYTRFWWSNPVNLQLVSSSQLAATISDAVGDPSEWSDWNGQRGDSSPAVTEAFVEASHNVKAIGLSFGGECFFETGVTTDNNTGNSEQFSSNFMES